MPSNRHRSSSRARSSSRPRARARAPTNPFPDRDLPAPYVKYPTWSTNVSSRPRQTRSIKFDTRPREVRAAIQAELDRIDAEEERATKRQRVVAWAVLICLFSMFLGAVLQLKADHEIPLEMIWLRVEGWMAVTIEQVKELWRSARSFVSGSLVEPMKQLGVRTIESVGGDVEQLKGFWMYWVERMRKWNRGPIEPPHWRGFEEEETAPTVIVKHIYV